MFRNRNELTTKLLLLLLPNMYSNPYPSHDIVVVVVVVVVVVFKQT